MFVKPFISLGYQLPIKPPFTDSRLVTCYQQHGLALWVEGECHAPDAIISVKPQLLHIRMTGAIESVDPRPAELRSKLFQQFRVRQQFVLHRLVQGVKLRLEIVMKRYLPTSQVQVCIERHNVVKDMSPPWRNQAMKRGGDTTADVSLITFCSELFRLREKMLGITAIVIFL